MNQLADMHMHAGFSPDPEALARALIADDVFCFANTVNPDEYLSLARSCAMIEGVRLGLGLHPWWIVPDNNSCNDGMLNSFLEVLPSSSYVGEIGLDFSPRRVETRELQLSFFDQIVAACAMREGLLISIHSVRAESEVIDIMKAHRLADANDVVLHSYAGSSENLSRAIDMGAFFSIGSRMLATKRGREYARVIPSDKVLVESDLPSFSGQNASAQDIRDDLEATLRQLAHMRDVDQQELTLQITERSRALLGFPNRR